MYDLQPYLNTIEDVIAQGPFKDTWESLSAYQVPDWYQNAKFGIFIHWGVYSVPAFGNEWYPRHMYKQGTPEYEHHLKTYGRHTEFGYKDFIPMCAFTRGESIEFAKGQLKGYFEEYIPVEFWQRLKLYLAYSSLYSILWAENCSNEEVEAMIKRKKMVYNDFTKSSFDSPCWVNN